MHAHAGVEFRVTEEYDEDSPFSRPPGWRAPTPKEDPPPANNNPDAHDAFHGQDSHHSSQHCTVASSPTDSTGNGSQPASATHASTDTIQSQPASGSQHRHEADQRLPSPAQSEVHNTQTSLSVGRGQVFSPEADTPAVLPAGIEISGHPDADEPGSTEQMDIVKQKPGVRRPLDSSNHMTSGSEQQGPPPPPQAQAAPQDPPNDPSSAERSDQGRPWWESAAASVSDAVSGGVDSVKGAVAAAYQAVGGGQSDPQSPGVISGSPPDKLLNADS